MILADTFGMPVDLEKIKALRLKKNWSFADAAQAAGFTNRQRWYQIESGTYDNITIRTLEAMAAALGVKAKDLLK